MLLVHAQDGLEIHLDQRMPDDVRQNFFPAHHAIIHGRAQSLNVHPADGIKAILARLAKTRDPFRVEMFFAQRIVAFGPRFDRQQVQHPFQPARRRGRR